MLWLVPLVPYVFPFLIFSHFLDKSLSHSLVDTGININSGPTGSRRCARLKSDLVLTSAIFSVYILEIKHELNNLFKKSWITLSIKIEISKQI